MILIILVLISINTGVFQYTMPVLKIYSLHYIYIIYF